MNPLIPMQVRQIGGTPQPSVNARELWQFVESRRDFSNWIQYRIEKYGFVENEDYLRNKFVGQVPHQGGLRAVEQIDYYLTIDTAKEMAMVEANAKGREVRRYFIDCERQARAAHEARSVAPDIFASKRMQRFAQKRILPRLDRYQNKAVNQKAAAMGRQMADICRDYLIWALAGTAQDNGEFQPDSVDDYDLQGVLYHASVEEVLAYAQTRENALRQAYFQALRG